MRINTDFFQFLVVNKKRACEMSRRVLFYIVAYNAFTIITKFKRF